MLAWIPATNAIPLRIWDRSSSWYLWLKSFSEKNVGGLDISVDDPSPAPPVQVMQAAGGADGDVVAQLPRHRW